ncbi:MAG: hypothetical protein K2X48_02145 [Chitinophagaceae bacterium]|nr:hypothetical protein [Chitinophagaceae bacterium]
MQRTHYPYERNHVYRYTFISLGRRRIKKVVEFSLTGIENIYNLAFGGIKIDGTVDDKASSNNGDIVRTLSTVIHILRDFSLHRPASVIFFTGSTKQRTRLYARIIKTYYDEFSKDFHITGLALYEKRYAEEIFTRENAYKYSAFLRFAALACRPANLIGLDKNNYSAAFKK